MRARNLPITGPCPVDLDRGGPAGEGKHRFCEHCDKHVHVISNMREVEAQAFLRRHAGQHLCLSYRVDADGRIQFRSDCEPELPQVGSNLVPAGVLARRVRRAVLAAPMPRAAAAVLLGALLSACAPHESPEERAETDKVEVVERELIGDVAIEPPPELMLAGAVSIPEEPPPVDGGLKLPEDGIARGPGGDTPCDGGAQQGPGTPSTPPTPMVRGEAPVRPPALAD